MLGLITVNTHHAMFDMYLLQYLYRAQGLLHCRRGNKEVFNLIFCKQS